MSDWPEARAQSPRDARIAVASGTLVNPRRLKPAAQIVVQRHCIAKIDDPLTVGRIWEGCAGRTPPIITAWAGLGPSPRQVPIRLTDTASERYDCGRDEVSMSRPARAEGAVFLVLGNDLLAGRWEAGPAKVQPRWAGYRPAPLVRTGPARVDRGGLPLPVMYNFRRA